MSGQGRRKPQRAKGLGVSDDEYAAMLAAQGGVCAICGTPPKVRRLNVDHDHSTGLVRALLCFICNHYILGKYATPEKLRAAADYLDLHSSSPERLTPRAGDPSTVPLLRHPDAAPGV